MPVLRAIARPMLASIFAVQGFDMLLHPERVIAQAEPVVRPVAERVPGVPAKLAARARVSGTGQGRKTDATDAHAIVMVALRDTGLRELSSDPELMVLRLLRPP